MYLSIDLGDKRCGIAIFLDGIVIPKDIVPRSSLVNSLKKYINDYNIKVIVVGLPYDLYNKNLKQLDKTKIFVEKLKVIFPNLKIDTCDERFTSFEADKALRELGFKNTKGQKDDISACIILETYLNSLTKN